MVNRLPHVFISYVRENQKEVDRLSQELTKHGVEVWLDRNDIEPGYKWKDAVREAIENGNFFIACFSQEYHNPGRTLMNEELVLAIDEMRLCPADRIWFIPVLLSECDVPVRNIGAGETLLDIEWIPLYADWEIGIQRILDVIQPIPAELQGALEALQSDHEEVRMSAVRALLKTAHGSDRSIKAVTEALSGQAGAASLLANALKDEDTEVCKTAAIVLGRIGNLGAVSVLIKVLKESGTGFIVHKGVPENAASALGEIGNITAVPALIAVLENGACTLRENAACALGQIGYSKAIPALIKALNDRGRKVRESAASALEKIYTPEALKAMEQYRKQQGTK